MNQLTNRLLNFFRENWLLLVFLGLLVVGFFTLRTKATPIESEQELQGLLSSGQPVSVLGKSEEQAFSNAAPGPR